LTKNIPRALVELGEAGIWRDQADRIVVGHRLLPQHRPNLSISGPAYKRTLQLKPLAAAASPSYKHRERCLFPNFCNFWRISYAAKPPCAG